MSSTDTIASKVSANAAPEPLTPLPSAIPAMWRALVRGYQAEPLLLVVSFSLALLAALPDALLALLLKYLVDGLAGGERRLVLFAAAGLAFSAAATWFLRVISDRTQRRFRDQVTIALESHVARLQASIDTIEHHERPELLDRLAVLRNQVFVLDHMYMSLFTTCGWVLRLVVTIGLLVSVHPLLSLLVLFAVPTMVVSAWRPAIERSAEERGAEASRRARHLFDVATTAAPGKEIRVCGVELDILARQTAARDRWYAPIASARWGSAIWHALTWTVFGLGFVAAVVFVARTLSASAGSVLLVLAAGSRLSSYIGATAGEIGFLRGIWMDGSQRMAWLEDYAAAVAEHRDRPVPTRIEQGIRFERVSFRYPGTDRLVLENVDLELPAGRVVAIVGENGAGKTTLVKLLCRLYAPSEGRILVDGEDLSLMPAGAWRERLAGAFQDFFRFEYTAQRSVGVGDVSRLDEREAVMAALQQAGDREVTDRLRDGLDTQLGPTWPGGVELSQGQWQKLAVARGFMRRSPLLLVLDEPTAALDAETEHALFEGYAKAAKQTSRNGAITLLVSHRFSTVRMADLIVVLDGSAVAEVGSHHQLMKNQGPYSRLYSIQAAGYGL
jgi:ATP-binding cassette subfamily B protein